MGSSLCIVVFIARVSMASVWYAVYCFLMSGGCTLLQRGIVLSGSHLWPFVNFSTNLLHVPGSLEGLLLLLAFLCVYRLYSCSFLVGRRRHIPRASIFSHAANFICCRSLPECLVVVW